MGSKFQSIYGREDQPLFRLTLVVVKARSVPGVVRGRDDGEEAFRHPAISLYALIELSERKNRQTQKKESN